MASTTSGLTFFTMDVDDIIRQALLPLGGEHTSGIESRDARITLNLLLIELRNKNIPLHKIDTITLPLQQDVSTYTLSSDIEDVLELTLERDNTETKLERYGLKEFHMIPQKELKQRPTVYTTERLLNSVKVKFWPIPNDNAYTTNLLVFKKIEDITASYQKLDVPTRYLPLIVKWLS